MNNVRIFGCYETDNETVNIRIVDDRGVTLPTLEVSCVNVSFKDNKIFFERNSNITESGNKEIGSINADVILVEYTGKDNIYTDYSTALLKL